MVEVMDSLFLYLLYSSGFGDQGPRKMPGLQV